MALSTYSDLLAAVARWSNRTDLTADIPIFVSLATERLNRDLRVRQMIGRAVASLDAGYSTLPTDFLAAINLTRGDVVLDYVTDDQIILVKDEVGDPRVFTINGIELQVSPVPASATSVELTYYKRIPDLSESETNWVFASFPSAYLYGALAELAQVTSDATLLARAEGRFADAVVSIETASAAAPAQPLKTDLNMINPGARYGRTFGLR